MMTIKIMDLETFVRINAIHMSVVGLSLLIITMNARKKKEKKKKVEVVVAGAANWMVVLFNGNEKLYT